MVKFKTVDFQERAQNRNNAQNNCCNNFDMQYGAFLAGTILGQIFSNMCSENYDTSSETYTYGKKTKTKDVKVVGDGNTSGKKEKTVDEIKELIENMYPGVIPNNSENWTNIAKKYNAHYMTSENWDTTEEAAVIKRLVLYDKALSSNQIQKGWDDLYQKKFMDILASKKLDLDSFNLLDPSEQELIMKECIKVCRDAACKDTDIMISLYKGNQDKKAEYLVSIFDRGAGYIEMYDQNDDGKISSKEFQDFEAKNNSVQTLNEEQKSKLNILFNYIDTNKDGSIDKQEMAEYLYGVSRINDNKDVNRNTSDDITMEEYINSQNWISDSENKESDSSYVNMDYWRNALKNDKDWQTLINL